MRLFQIVLTRELNDFPSICRMWMELLLLKIRTTMAVKFSDDDYSYLGLPDV